jgi:hypothetical protein
MYVEERSKSDQARLTSSPLVSVPLSNSTVSRFGAGNHGFELGQNYGTISTSFVLPPS